MLSLFKKFGVGIVYGMGFAVGVVGMLALGVVGGASFLTSTTNRSVSWSPSASNDSRSSENQFVISDTSMINNTWGSISILGTIENKGADSKNYVNVYADLLNKEGKFIYQCTHQFGEGLRKDQRANFMIQCHGMPQELAAAFASFKVYARSF